MKSPSSHRYIKNESESDMYDSDATFVTNSEEHKLKKKNHRSQLDNTQTATEHRKIKGLLRFVSNEISQSLLRLNKPKKKKYFDMSVESISESDEVPIKKKKRNDFFTQDNFRLSSEDITNSSPKKTKMIKELKINGCDDLMISGKTIKQEKLPDVSNEYEISKKNKKKKNKLLVLKKSKYNNTLEFCPQNIFKQSSSEEFLNSTPKKQYRPDVILNECLIKKEDKEERDKGLNSNISGQKDNFVEFCSQGIFEQPDFEEFLNSTHKKQKKSDVFLNGCLTEHKKKKKKDKRSNLNIYSENDNSVEFCAQSIFKQPSSEAFLNSTPKKQKESEVFLNECLTENKNKKKKDKRSNLNLYGENDNTVEFCSQDIFKQPSSEEFLNSTPKKQKESEVFLNESLTENYHKKKKVKIPNLNLSGQKDITVEFCSQDIFKQPSSEEFPNSTPKKQKESEVFLNESLTETKDKKKKVKKPNLNLSGQKDNIVEFCSQDIFKQPSSEEFLNSTPKKRTESEVFLNECLTENKNKKKKDKRSNLNISGQNDNTVEICSQDIVNQLSSATQTATEHRKTKGLLRLLSNEISQSLLRLNVKPKKKKYFDMSVESISESDEVPIKQKKRNDFFTQDNFRLSNEDNTNSSPKKTKMNKELKINGCDDLISGKTIKQEKLPDVSNEYEITKKNKKKKNKLLVLKKSKYNNTLEFCPQNIFKQSSSEEFLNSTPKKQYRPDVILNECLIKKEDKEERDKGLNSNISGQKDNFVEFCSQGIFEQPDFEEFLNSTHKKQKKSDVFLNGCLTEHKEKKKKDKRSNLNIYSENDNSVEFCAQSIFKQPSSEEFLNSTPKKQKESEVFLNECLTENKNKKKKDKRSNLNLYGENDNTVEFCSQDIFKQPSSEEFLNSTPKKQKESEVFLNESLTENNHKKKKVKIPNLNLSGQKDNTFEFCSQGIFKQPSSEEFLNSTPKKQKVSEVFLNKSLTENKDKKKKGTKPNLNLSGQKDSTFEFCSQGIFKQPSSEEFLNSTPKKQKESEVFLNESLTENKDKKKKGTKPNLNLSGQKDNTFEFCSQGIFKQPSSEEFLNSTSKKQKKSDVFLNESLTGNKDKKKKMKRTNLNPSGQKDNTVQFYSQDIFEQPSSEEFLNSTPKRQTESEVFLNECLTENKNKKKKDKRSNLNISGQNDNTVEFCSQDIVNQLSSEEFLNSTPKKQKESEVFLNGYLIKHKKKKKKDKRPSLNISGQNDNTLEFCAQSIFKQPSFEEFLNFTPKNHKESEAFFNECLTENKNEEKKDKKSSLNISGQKNNTNEFCSQEIVKQPSSEEFRNSTPKKQKESDVFLNECLTENKDKKKEDKRPNLNISGQNDNTLEFCSQETFKQPSFEEFMNSTPKKFKKKKKKKSKELNDNIDPGDSIRSHNEIKQENDLNSSTDGQHDVSLSKCFKKKRRKKKNKDPNTSRLSQNGCSLDHADNWNDSFLNTSDSSQVFSEQCNSFNGSSDNSRAISTSDQSEIRMSCKHKKKKKEKHIETDTFGENGQQEYFYCQFCQSSDRNISRDGNKTLNNGNGLSSRVSDTTNVSSSSENLNGSIDKTKKRKRKHKKSSGDGTNKCSVQTLLDQYLVKNNKILLDDDDGSKSPENRSTLPDNTEDIASNGSDRTSDRMNDRNGSKTVDDDDIVKKAHGESSKESLKNDQQDNTVDINNAMTNNSFIEAFDNNNFNGYNSSDKESMLPQIDIGKKKQKALNEVTSDILKKESESKSVDEILDSDISSLSIHLSNNSYKEESSDINKCNSNSDKESVLSQIDIRQTKEKSLNEVTGDSVKESKSNSVDEILDSDNSSLSIHLSDNGFKEESSDVDRNRSESDEVPTSQIDVSKENIPKLQKCLSESPTFSEEDSSDKYLPFKFLSLDYKHNRNSTSSNEVCEDDVAVDEIFSDCASEAGEQSDNSKQKICDTNKSSSERSNGNNVDFDSSDDSDDGVDDIDKVDVMKSRLKSLVIEVDFSVPKLHQICNRASKPTPQQRLKITEEKIPIKKGKFMKAEDEKIKENWWTFIKTYSFDDVPEVFYSLHKKYISINEKQNFLFFLAQGLDERTPFSVFQRFRLLMMQAKRGRFTEEEDQYIKEKIKETGRRRSYIADIATHLQRPYHSVEKRIKRLNDQHTRKIRWKKKNLAFFIKYLLKVTGTEPDELEKLKNRHISSQEWLKLSKKLDDVPSRILKRAWLVKIHPMLFIPETRCDLREVKLKLINMFDENKEYEWRAVNWSNYVSHFEGLTPLRLYSLVKILVTCRVPAAKRKSLRKCVRILKSCTTEELLPHFVYKIKYEKGNVIQLARKPQKTREKK